MPFSCRPVPARVLVAALAFLLAFAPYRAIAQAAQPGAPSTATAPAANSSSSQPSHSQGEQNEQNQSQADQSQDQDSVFVHSPVVQSLARIIHLDVNTTALLFLGINFAIIFFAIAVPLGRFMPKLFRKRSQTLKHDLETARDATADARSRLNAIEAKLAGLGDEMKKLRDQVEQDSLEDEKRIKATISEESARIVAAAEQEIGVAATAARRELRNFAAALAIDHAEKQLALTPETDRALISEFVAGVSAGGAAKGGSN
jgi:F-type H+-transporting ATPase subunit b